MDAEHELILRLFARAAHKVGSVSRLAMMLGVSYADVAKYMQGEAIPPEAVLLRAVELILDDVAHFRNLYPDAWESLSLPK